MVAEEKKEAAVKGRAQRRASRTRKKLVDAALALIGKQGAEAVTIEEITELADVGKGTFYRHFENREELIAALTEDAANRLVEAMRAPAGKAETRDEAVARLASAHGAFYRSEPAAFALLFERRDASVAGGPRARYLSALEAALEAAAPGADKAAIKYAALVLAGCATGCIIFAESMTGREATTAALDTLMRASAVAATAAL